MLPFSEWALGENKIIRRNQTSSFIPGSPPDIIGFRNRDQEGGFFWLLVIPNGKSRYRDRLCRKNQGILAESFRHPEDNSSHYQWEGSVTESHISQVDELEEMVVAALLQAD